MGLRLPYVLETITLLKDTANEVHSTMLSEQSH